MSDTLTNALQQSAHTGSVLQGIMNPAQVNPLAGMGSAINLVSGMQGLAESNAKQAAGQAFLNSIDPATGQPNQSLLMQNLQRDPSTAYAAQEAAQRGVNLDTSTYNLHAARISRASDALGSLIGRFPNGIPGDQFHAAIDQELSTGLITPAEAQQLHGTVTSDPKQNSIAATQLYFHNMSNGQQLERMYGTRAPIDTPTAHYIVDQPPPGTGAVTVTPKGTAPGDTTPARVLVDDQGIIPLDANGRPTRPNGRYQTMPVPTATVPGVPQGGPPVTTPGPGGAPAVAAPPGSLPPGVPPTPPGTQPGRLVDGRFVTTPPATPAPKAAAPPPAVPPVATPPAATPPAATPPATVAAPVAVRPPVFTSEPQGQPDLVAKDNEVRTAANLAMPDQQKRLIAGNSALEALKLADTGPSTGFFAHAYAFFKAQGITPVPQGQLSDTDYRQLLQKNLLRFAQSSGRSSGTDLGLETQIHSNANVDDMLAGANRHVLIQDLGILKRDIAQTQEMPTSGPAGSVVKHVGEFPTKVAPEAFMWDTYTDAERAAIKQDYTDKGKLQQLEDSVHLAIRRGAIPPPRPARPTVVTPPAPAPNALVPTN